MSKFAYDIGAALGMMKSGSVERVEKENTKLLKIAKLLQKKGKLTKAAFKWPWDYSGTGSEGYDPTNPEHKKRMLANVASRGAGIGAGEPEGSPRAEVAAKLRAYGKTGDKEIAAGRKPIPGLKGPKGKKGKKAGPISLASGVKPAAKGPISLNDSDDWDEKSPLSLDSVGGSDDGDENGPLSLDSGGGTHRRNIQLYGVDAANRMKAGGRQPGGGPSKAEQGFWGGPKFGDMQRYWLQMLGKTPSQLSGEDVAREAGYGRALQHKQNLDWIKSMLMGPQMGHYGMGG